MTPVGCQNGQPSPSEDLPSNGWLRLAVLGDSDSHSYRDTRALPPPMRGGPFRPQTHQWTEILQILRGSEIDQGAWGRWEGMRRRYALPLRLLGRHVRVEPKVDFEFNLAVSGARCPDLVRGAAQQVDPILGLLKRNAAEWDRGVVVIRIGVNSISTPNQLQRYRVEGLDERALSDIRDCSSAIRAAMGALRRAHPTIRILLVGLFDESDAPPLIQEAIPPEELKRLREVLDRFDEEVRHLAEEDSLAAFLEDRTWWQERWGSHDPETGLPQPLGLSLGGPTRISNTKGDHPRNAILEDGHAGTAVNGIWAQNLVSALRREFGFDLTPIALDEIARVVDPDGSYGIRGGG